MAEPTRKVSDGLKDLMVVIPDVTNEKKSIVNPSFAGAVPMSIINHKHNREVDRASSSHTK